MTTERPRQPSGSACWKWASSGRSRRRSRGSEPGHPRLLEARRQLDRLDAGRDEVGAARDGGEAQVGREPRQLAQQVRDVGLVAGALAAEHVGVDQDHASSS